MITRSITRGITRSIFRSVTRAVQRFFTKLDAEGFFIFESTVLLNGNYVVEFETDTSFTGAQMVLGNSTTSSSSIFISGQDLSIRDHSGTTLSTIGNSIPNGELNRTRLVKSGSTLTVFINGASITSGAFGNLEIDRVGVRQTNSFPFDGFIANLKITNVSTIVVDSPFDEDFSRTSTAANKANQNNNLTTSGVDASALYELNPAGTVYTAANGDTIDVA